MKEDPTRISRRQFLKGVGAATTALSLGNLTLRLPEARGGQPAPHPYDGWQDLYRDAWTWDRVVKGTHYVNCAYQRGCNWNVYTRNGMVWREEQVASYPQTNPEVPDYNPRGCQKGACYSERMYDASRLRHPLKRVGVRGEGRWKRISWKEALREIADATIDALISDGPRSLVWDMGTAVTNGCHGLGLLRTNALLDSVVLETNSEIGDHYPGAAATLGKICFNSSADDLFYSDLVLVWGGNPTTTQIPNAHFINEARYHGARIVTITPDMNSSAIHADEWIAVEVGSDAALGLSLAHVMIEERIYDAAFVREQTDLPLLVRDDTHRLLRASDIEAGGAEDTFYVYDSKTGEVRQAPKSELALGDLEPALEGTFQARLNAGEVIVTPVFALLKKRVASYSPEETVRITGVHASIVRRLARMIAGARAATFITQTNFSKYYHGLEMERAQILVLTLAGQIGKKGSGITGFPYLSLAGTEALSMTSGSLSPRLGLAALGLTSAPEMLKLRWQGYTTEMTLYEMGRKEYAEGRFLATPLFLYFHGGLESLYGSARRWDPWLKRDFADHLDEALDKQWQFAPRTAPRILFEVGGNLLRRARGYDRIIDHLLPKLDLLVTLDWRMSNTARYSDYVLPAAGWYEKDDITWASPIAPFCHVTTRAVEPLGSSKPDWEFHCLFLKVLQRRAIARGIRSYNDSAGESRRLDRIYDDFTFGGRFTEHNTEEFLNELLAIASNVGGVDWPTLKEKGFVRYTELGMGFAQIGNATDITANETITANTWHTANKQPWPTLTRRMQFYLDHDVFLELGEELPIHKDNPRVGGDYPLQMTGGHTRWSIHASWRDQTHMLRLQRSGPCVHIGTDAAAARGINDGDRVRVYNDVGAFEAEAKVTPTVRPGQVIVYHAWEPYQFKGQRSQQTLTPSPMNPIQLAGGYFHLQPMLISGQPGCPDRATRVEISRLDTGA